MQEQIQSIQQFKIADEICADHYESCPPLLRSVIKTAAAFHFSMHSPLKSKEIFTDTDRSGFCSGTIYKKIPYLFMIIDKNYQSPAKFLAVLCRAVLAEIPHIFVFLDKNLPHAVFNAYINCMELCGIENSYYLPDEKTLADLDGKLQIFFNSAGRHVLFSDTALYCGKLGTKNTFREHIKVSIAARAEQEELLRLAYGSCADIRFAAEKSTDTARAQFQQLAQNPAPVCDISFLPSCPGIQNYGSGMEFCFIASHMPQHFLYHAVFFANLETNYPQSE